MHKFYPLRVYSLHIWAPGESSGSVYGNDNQGFFLGKLLRSAESKVWLAKGQPPTHAAVGTRAVQGLLLTSHQLLAPSLHSLTVSTIRGN